MASPTILAGEAIEINRCVQFTTSQAIGTKTILGSTAGGVTAVAAVNGTAIKFQPGPFYLLTAGGTITSGDFLVPSTNGTVVTSTTSGQFIAIESSTSGKTVNARKAS
jgi:hypothetical protein